MFVVTVGPLSKSWSKVIRFVAVGVVLLLLLLAAWKVMGSGFATQTGETGGLGQELATFGQGVATGFWQRFLGALEQWFRFGF